MSLAKLKFSAFVVLIFVSMGAASQETKKERVDLHGDPLPKQALFRIGTTRLQHAGQVRALATSDDGRFLASVGSDKAVCVWDAKDGRLLWKFDVPSWGPWGLAFSRDGKELAAVSRSPENTKENGAFRRWDLTTGRALPNGRDVADNFSHFTYHVALVGCGDDTYLAAETAGHDISLYSPEKPKDGKTLKGHTGRVMCLCFTKDAKALISLGDEGMIRIWNIEDGKVIAKLPAPSMKDHSLKGNLACIAIAPNGKSVAVSLTDGSTRLLDEEGRELRRIRTSEQMNALAFSPNGNAFFTGGNLIESWNVDNAEPIDVLGQPRNPLRTLSLSPDGQTAACADERDRLRLVEIGTGKVLTDREIPCRGGIAFSPQGKSLAVATGETIGFWDVASLRASQKPSRFEPATILRCQGKVEAFVFSPDGKRLATAEGKVSRIYDVASKKQTQTLTPPSRNVFAVAFSTDGKLLATMGEQPFFRHGLEIESVPKAAGLWDSFTGKELAIGDDLRQLAHTIVFHPNGKSLAALHLPVVAKDAPHSGFKDLSKPAIPVEDRMETIRLWNSGFNREAFRFEDPVQRKNAEGASAWIIGRSRPVAAAFSPDGRLFATPGPGGMVLFETVTGQPRLRLVGHLGEITALAFTPDGNTLVSTSSDSTLVIWDVTGQRTGTKASGSTEDFWALLADADAERAGRAIFALVDLPVASITMLRKRLHPVSVNGDRIQKLVADLDNPAFAVRDRAGRELATLGPIAEVALTKKLQAKPSLEASRRIEELLMGIKSVRPQSNEIRTIRAVEVLERIGSRDARAFLAALAAGAEGAYLTSHASEALDRMNRRHVEPYKNKRQ